MAFKLVAGTARTRTSEPSVTIRTNGVVLFNKGVADKVKGCHVEIYHDEESAKIGFKFMEEKTENSVPVGKSGNISAKSKLVEIGDSGFKDNLRYTAVVDEGMVVINLMDGKVVTPRPRKKKMPEPELNIVDEDGDEG